ncbi:MAG: hypothetical protein ACRCTZ_03430 [Sarcina sp.]
MIINNVKVQGIAPKSELDTINSTDLILNSFNFELNNINDLSSVYELTLDINKFYLNNIKLKDSTITTVSFTLLTKVLYSTPNNAISIKEVLFPYIYNLTEHTNISKLLILDCNFSVNASSISLSLLIGFIKEQSVIKIYKTKNYIKTVLNENFDSTFDFL